MKWCALKGMCKNKVQGQELIKCNKFKGTLQRLGAKECLRTPMLKQFHSVLNNVSSVFAKDALTDVPYANVCLFLAKLTVNPVLLLSQRAPLEWAHRRVEAHKGQDLSCRNWSTGISPFDIYSCLNKATSKYVEDILVRHDELIWRFGYKALARRFIEHVAAVEFYASLANFPIYKICPKS